MAGGAPRVSSPTARSPGRPQPAAPLTFFVLALFAALAALALWNRRRHLRLKAACSAAFARCYAATSPPPAFEMAYSYGEPVFQVLFASPAAMAGAADANAAFLREIDDLCKARGRRRQFKAQRAVFFQHPPVDEPVVTHCCQAMRAQVGKTIAYQPQSRGYGLKPASAGATPLEIGHCPWCGSPLPPPAAHRPG